MTNNLLIIGLGNPGPLYQNTRHNLGAVLIEKLCAYNQVSLQLEKKFNALFAKFQIDELIINCLVPQTFMNLSGNSIQSYLKYYQMPIEQLIIAHDELNLSPGCADLKSGGGHGGHNGLRHIIQCLGTADFKRLRLGIGQAGSRAELSNYVLNQAKPDEKIAINILLDNLVSQWQNLLAKDWHNFNQCLKKLSHRD